MTKVLWGGRFRKEIHPKLKEFSYSLATDSELFEAEVAVNMAYVKMLARVRLITESESVRLLRGLTALLKEFSKEDILRQADQCEDIHSFIQFQLERKVGDAAQKIHTGRSRNDLVVTSTRVYLRERTNAILEKLGTFQRSLVSSAEAAKDAIIPGLTHFKKAQPVLLAHHLLAYVEMIEEDKERLQDALKRIDVLGLGAGSLAGSSLPIDRKFLAKELGFRRISSNSLAAVSDRAFMAEFLNGLAVLWVHLSRLSEDFILWNSEFCDYVEIDDAFATGSSLMPQKKNPDVFELVRGRSAVILGDLQSLLVLQKGLALAYNRDLQEDKPSLFDGVHKTELALELLALTLLSVTFNRVKMREAVSDEGLYATDLVEYLVRKGVPFSEAHRKIGEMVREAKEQGVGMSKIPLRTLKEISKEFETDVSGLFDPVVSVFSKKTLGSTHPGRVKREIAKWRRRLK